MTKEFFERGKQIAKWADANMTKDEALKMAIEFIDKLKTTGQTNWLEINVIKNACKEALEQPTPAPVGKWESKCKCDFRTKLVGDGCRYCNTEEYIDRLHEDYNELLEENKQLLAHPAPSWQGLSDDEIQEELKKMWDKGLIPSYRIVDFARAIEQALKEKNNAPT